MKAFLFTLLASLPLFVVLRALSADEIDWAFNLCAGLVSFMFTQIWIAAIISASRKE